MNTKPRSVTDADTEFVHVDVGAKPSATEPNPIVQAKRPSAADKASESEDERSAAEIVRLSSWATAECGGTILAD